MKYLLIKKTGHKEYMIYLSDINEWWGYYNSFNECVDIGLKKIKENEHIKFHPNISRRLKLNKIWKQNK